MNPSQAEIEQALRNAPQPLPPRTLKGALLNQVVLPVAPAKPALASRPQARPAWQPRPWLNSWWPVLATACLAMACAVFAAVQQSELTQLRASVQALRQQVARSAHPVDTNDLSTTSAAAAVELPDPRKEIERLKAAVQQAGKDVRQLETLSAVNQRLHQQLAQGTGFTAEELDRLDESQKRAEAIRCINNLKQMGLSARVWANDNHDLLPPDVLSMSNELSSPLVLICPGDAGRQAATNWASFSMANCSYDYLAASGTEAEPQRVAFRCPIHGHVGLCDGSVQGYVAKKHPEQLVIRDGKLWMEESNPQPQPATENPAPGTVSVTGGAPLGMDERMARRYGLLPAQPATNAPSTTPAQ